MPTPKKSLLACVSAAALVASFGFVQAQSSDQDAAAMANVNGGVDRGEDTRAYPSDNLPANSAELAYEAPAAGPAEPATSPWAADTAANAQAPSSDMQAAGAGTASPTTMDGSQSAQAGTYRPDIGVRGTPCIPEGSVGQKSAQYDPAVSDCPEGTTTAMSADTAAPAAPADTTMAAAPATTAAPDSNMTVTSAPETRVDLSPPSDPLYNLANSGERAPRPDRN